jgi:uncharacterized repeat protein (TIGR03803 family)
METHGVVFKVDASGNETVLHSFTGGTDGGYPSAGLLLDAAGNLYGDTGFNGAFAYGTVFKLDASTTHKLTLLHSFNGGRNGGTPVASLIRDAACNLYGTTLVGGVSNAGVVFKLDTAGNETLLYSFTRGWDGVSPFGSLIRDAAGNLYGRLRRRCFWFRSGVQTHTLKLDSGVRRTGNHHVRPVQL